MKNWLLLLCLSLCVLVGSASSSEPPAPSDSKPGDVVPDLSWKKDDFKWIKGANYTPSYASNDVVTWNDFDAEVVDRELGYAKKLGLNSVRTWLQYIVYEDNPKRFLENFETYLSLCDKHGIRAMPILFDSCFGMEPKLDWKGAWVHESNGTNIGRMPCFSQTSTKVSTLRKNRPGSFSYTWYWRKIRTLLMPRPWA